jgi:hypothetical protein
VDVEGPLAARTATTDVSVLLNWSGIEKVTRTCGLSDILFPDAGMSLVRNADPASIKHDPEAYLQEHRNLRFLLDSGPGNVEDNEKNSQPQGFGAISHKKGNTTRPI